MDKAVLVERGGRVADLGFGLESVLRAHQKLIRTKSDVVVVWLNWLLLKNGFLCSSSDDATVESLPASIGWDGARKCYLLKYVKDDTSYGLGVWVREGSYCDISLVTMSKSLKIGLDLNDILRDDCSLKPIEA